MGLLTNMFCLSFSSPPLYKQMCREGREGQGSARVGGLLSGSFPAAAPSTGTGCIPCPDCGTCSSSKGAVPSSPPPSTRTFCSWECCLDGSSGSLLPEQTFPAKASAKEILGRRISFFLSKYTADWASGSQLFSPVLVQSLCSPVALVLPSPKEGGF